MLCVMYRSAAGVARLAKAAIALEVVLSGSMVAVLGAQALLLGVNVDEAPSYHPHVGPVALAMLCSALGVVLGLVIAATFFLVWLHRAYASAGALGAELADSPGYAVGCWFIPFVNLYQPLRVVQALDAAAAPEAELEGVITGSRDTSLWWGLWIGVGFVGGIVGRIAEDISPTAWFLSEALAWGVRVATAVLVLRIITRITENLDRKAREQGVLEVAPLRF